MHDGKGRRREGQEEPEAEAGRRNGRNGFSTRRRWLASTRISPISRRATTRWWASAASRCPAGRSSGPRSRGRLSIDPRILILDDSLSAVDTYTEEEILSRLRGVMRAADLDHRVAPDFDGARRRPDPRARRRAHRRARHARRADRARRPVRRAAPQAAARGRTGGVVPCISDDEILGKAYDATADAPAAGVSASVLARRWPCAFVAIIARRRRGAGAALPDEGGDRSAHRRRASSKACDSSRSSTW